MDVVEVMKAEGCYCRSCDELGKENERLREEREDLIRALDHAISIFDGYITHHLNKTPPDYDKAANNERHRKILADVISGADQPPNDGGNRRMTASEAQLAGVRVDRRVMRLAALFVQPDGCYAGLPDVDAWPEARDARHYTGPLPVVAHPPCQLWGAMAVVNYARWGGEHNKPGNDGGCFAAALESVRRFGGVLEHPAKTKAWAAHGLAKPEGIGWQRTIDGGWVCEVWQSAYGHRAAKATWLYYNGTNPPFELRWYRPAGTHQIGFHDQRGKAANKPTLGKREANATPLEFRDELLRLALKAHNSQ